jgi:acyl-CoA thioester hydrolase
MSTSFPFTHRLEVRFRDCDSMGHVNHAVYFTYLEQCRFALWRHVYGVNGLPGAGTIMAHAECDYRAPAFVNEALDVRARVERIGRSSVALAYEIVNAATGQCLANGKTVIVTYDYDAGRSMPIPADARAALEQLRSEP